MEKAAEEMGRGLDCWAALVPPAIPLLFQAASDSYQLPAWCQRDLTLAHFPRAPALTAGSSLP